MAGFKSARAKAPTPIDLKEKGAAGSIDEALRNVTSALNSHDDEIKKLNGGLTLGQNTVGIVKLLSFKMPDDPPWKTSPFALHADMITGSPSAEALMEPGGLVRLRGAAISNPAGTHPAGLIAGSPILTMGAGYRPVQTMGLPNFSLAGAAATPNGVSLNTAGLFNNGLACTTVFLDGLQWYATAAAPPHQFDEPNWPLRVQHGLDRARGLVVMGFRLSGQAGQNVGMGTPHVDWQDIGDGALRINGVWGLQWGQKYDLRVYISPEEEE